MPPKNVFSAFLVFVEHVLLVVFCCRTCVAAFPR